MGIDEGDGIGQARAHDRYGVTDEARIRNNIF